MGRNLIAFDIGESQVKIAWYNGNTRKKTVCAPLIDNLVSGGEILSMDAMADFLRDIVNENHIPHASAAVILPASLVFTRNIDVPAMTDSQLGYNLPYEFKDYLTEEKSSYYFDYAVQELVKDEQGNASQMHLFACAALKKTIADYREMFHRAGFRLKSVIPEESAYAALLMAAPEVEGDTCFLDIGYNAVRMLFYRGDSFVTRRTVNLGTRDLVQTLSELRGVDTHMAHEHLRSNYENALNEPALLDLYHNMAVEIMKVANFYNYNNREQMLKRIYLCGGGTAITPLRDAISELTDFELCSAADWMPSSADIESPWLYVKAVGCALQA